jgi:hypothetical protein
MSIVTFLLLLVIAAIAAGVQIIIGSTPPDLRGRSFAALFVAYALLLTLAALLPKLLGG